MKFDFNHIFNFREPLYLIYRGFLLYLGIVIKLGGSVMIKKISLKNSVYELCTNFSEIKDILKSLGFESISNSVMLNTAGRVMTIPKAAVMKNINIDKIKEMFKENGFEIVE